MHPILRSQADKDAAIAWLHGLTAHQKDLLHILPVEALQRGRTDSAITKAKRRAETAGFLRTVPDTVAIEAGAPGVIRMLEELLCKTVSGCRVWVAPSDPGPNDREEPGNFTGKHNAHMDRVCEFAARILTLMFSRNGVRNLAVVYGYTVSRCIDRIAALWDVRMQGRSGTKGSKSEFSVIPVSGEPMYLMNTLNKAGYSSSTLAHRLQSTLNGKDSPPPASLLGVPCYVPTRPAGGITRAALMDHYRAVPGYQSIFGSDNRSGLLRETDILITSAGALSQEEKVDHLGAFIQERIKREAVPAKWEALSKELRGISCGDFAGTLLPREGSTAEDDNRLLELNRGWLGLDEERLRTVASVANDSNRLRPGVVVIAHGEQKADIIFRAIRRELVYNVICDKALYQGLCKLQKQDI